MGAGLAGMVAARAMASAGASVRMFEALGHVGGKTASWSSPRGRKLDTGLHLCFPYYQHLSTLQRELGVDSCVEWTEPVLHYLEPAGAAQMRFANLPVSVQGLMAIAGHRQLRIRDRASALPAALDALYSRTCRRRGFDTLAFAQWARRRGASTALVAKVLEPIIRGLTFLPGDAVSAFTVTEYVHAIGRSRDTFRFGVFREGVGEALVQPLFEELKRRGVASHVGCRVAQLEVSGGRVSGVRLDDGSLHEADAVVCAVPAHGLSDLLPIALRGNPAFDGALRLRPVAVASAMMWFDRPLPGPRGVRLSPGCVFNTWIDMADFQKDTTGSTDAALQLVLAPMTAELSALDDDALSARVLSDLHRVHPVTRDAKLVDVEIVRTPASFHAAVPGAEALRPPTDVGIPGLALAGDYVRTGFGANMESATASGLQAARHALRSS